MPEKRIGSDNLVSTSAHIPFAYLERIKKIGVPPSKFIREAVGEKLEREEGFIAAIALQEAEYDRLGDELERVVLRIANLREQHEEWKQKKEIARIQDIIMTEYLTRMLRTEQELYTAVESQIDTTHNLKKIVHDTWIEFKGAKGKREILEDEGATTTI